ncbi:MAG TPA: condensation domain-containing protein, partial [Phytomonospora sp.]
AVLALRGPDGAPYLAAFLALEPGADTPDGLDGLFPAYVAPKTWTVLDALPRDASGTHDFTALLSHAPALSTGDAESPRIQEDESPQASANPPATEPEPVDNPVDDVREGPLNHVQSGMTDFFGRFGTALNIPVQVDLSGPLDPAVLKEAFDALAARHHSLRSRFAEHEGEWFQEVLDTATVPESRLKMLDLTALAEDQRPARADAHAEEARAEEFDLGEGHAWRGVLIRLSEQDWRLVLVFHHVLVDDWARALFLTELAELYNAAAEQRPARLPAATQAIAHALSEPDAEADVERRLTYWTDRLDGVPLGLVLPYDRPGGRDRDRALQEIVLPPEVADAAAELGERQDTGPFAVYAAALGVFLSRLAGTENLFLRTQCALRDAPGDETVMASLSLSGALELDLTGDLDFAGLVARTGDDHADGAAHHVTFPRLLEALAEKEGGGTVGDAVQFLFPGSTVSAPHFNGIDASFTAEPIHMVPGTIFMCFPAGDGWRLALQYSPGELDEATVSGWLDTWATVLQQLCADPDTPIADL